MAKLSLQTAWPSCKTIANQQLGKKLGGQQLNRLPRVVLVIPHKHYSFCGAFLPTLAKKAPLKQQCVASPLVRFLMFRTSHHRQTKEKLRRKRTKLTPRVCCLKASDGRVFHVLKASRLWAVEGGKWAAYTVSGFSFVTKRFVGNTTKPKNRQSADCLFLGDTNKE